MTLLINVLGTKSLSFFLMLSGEGKIAFGIHEIERSLTPLGWVVIIILPIALIFGVIYLIAKVLKKTKLK
ncbi:MAG: hypothetical protein M3R14_09265 [Acidobacteriota bacterium]|nr:hypothetical protein [Acidobacteriota bacterium]